MFYGFALLFMLLAGVSIALLSQASRVQLNSVIPFLNRMGRVSIREVLTEEEIEIAERKVFVFGLRLISCMIAVPVAIGTGLLFLLLLALESSHMDITGYIMAATFAYVLANYNIGSIDSWIQSAENDILARIIANKPEASEFKTLESFVYDEISTAFKEFEEQTEQIIEKQIMLIEELDGFLSEEGFDPDNVGHYEAHFNEFLSILAAAMKKLEAKYPDLSQEFPGMKQQLVTLYTDPTIPAMK